MPLINDQLRDSGLVPVSRRLGHHTLIEALVLSFGGGIGFTIRI